MNLLQQSKILVFLLIPASAFAQNAGELDNTFGINGSTLSQLSVHGDEIVAIAIQSNGKIVGTGFHHNGIDQDFMVVRYTNDGQLDPSFGTNGITITTFSNSVEIPTCLTLQDDGKIVVAGWAHTGNCDRNFAVARYNSDGSPDLSFQSDGKQLIPGISWETPYSVKVTSTNKILMAGVIGSANHGNNFGMIRLNSNGDVDTSFGNNGRVVTDINSGSNDIANSIFLTDSDEILLAGSSGDFTNSSYTVVRYSPSGILDGSFGINGIATFNHGTTLEYCKDIRMQSSGKIILGGFVRNTTGTGSDLSVIRLNSNGTLDNTFGTNGISTLSIANIDNIWSIIIDSQDRIITAGKTGYDALIMRFLEDGALDISFGSNGYTISDFGSWNDNARAIAFQTPNKIIIGGTRSDDNLSLLHSMIARYHADDVNSINTLIQSAKSFIYPIPVTSSSIFEYQLDRSEIISISLINIQGITVDTFLEQKRVEQGIHQVTLGLIDLPKGNYILRFMNGKHTTSIPFVK